MSDKLYDVIIYEYATGKVESVPGKSMRMHKGYHNAEKRLDTVLSRINDAYSAAIVDEGKYKKGDIYKQ